MEISSRTIRTVKPGFVSALSGLYGDEEAGALFDHLAMEWLGWTRTDLKLLADKDLGEDFFLFLKDAELQLASGRPLQYILGFTFFDGLKLKIDERALIPRPETEELVELLSTRYLVHSTKDIYNDLSFLDIGTGSGCIALALKRRFPGAEVIAVDASEHALSLAAGNGIGNKLIVDFRKMNILDPQEYGSLGDRMFDLIVSNPPYVLESERDAMHASVVDHEPHQALFVSDKDPLLFYKAIVIFAMRYLKEGGVLGFEVNPLYAETVKELCVNAGLKEAKIHKDLSGKERFVFSKHF